jgi:hypothetical protein
MKSFIHAFAAFFIAAAILVLSVRNLVHFDKPTAHETRH